MMLTIEIVSVLLTFVYLYLISNLNRMAWLFGIAASILMAYIFYIKNFYGSFFLNIVYVLQGIMGFIVWGKEKSTHLPQNKISLTTHVYIIFSVVLVFRGINQIFTHYNYSEFNNYDIFLALVCIVATFLEIKKEISSWVYWIIANLAYSLIYFTNNLYYYAFLSLFLGFYSIIIFIYWKKRMKV